MFDFREYIIAVTAIFLALALGLLIGISYGEDFLVSNQRETIELLERELARQRGFLAERDRELGRWESLKPAILGNYSGSLIGKEILVLASGKNLAGEIRALLEGAGADTAALYLPGTTTAVPPDGAATMSRAVRIREALTAPGGLDWKVLEEEGFRWSGIPPAGAPCCYVLLLDRPGSPENSTLFLLWEELHRGGLQVVAASSWREGESIAVIDVEDYCLVDNVDTFWGQLALLEIIRFGYRGGYGFDPSRVALLPSP